MRVTYSKPEKPKEYIFNNFHCLEFGDNEAILKYCKWPEELLKYKPNINDICNMVKDYEYIKVNTPVGFKPQPRKTLCYDYSYKYSGQEHPIEKETPEFITQFYKYIEKEFNEPVNMCLLNVYFHGRHSISAHSDDEKQMGKSTNVFCFVIGDEPRIAHFKSKDKTKSYSIVIPEGLYIMSGKNFQKDFTHEFPKMYESMYKHIKVPDTVSNIYKADWIWDHQDQIKEQLKETIYFDDFIKWCKPRASFTLRHFTEGEVNKKKRF